MDNPTTRTRIFLGIAFIILLVLSYFVIRPFFTTILFTIILIIVLKPLYNYLLGTKRLKGRKRLAATAALFIAAALVLVPAFLIIYLTVSQLSSLLVELDNGGIPSVLDGIERLFNSLPLASDISLEPEEIEATIRTLLGDILAFLAGVITDLLSSVMVFIVQMIIFVVLYIVLMPEYDNLVRRMEETSPLGREISSLYYRKTAAMVTSLVTGIFLVAIIQGFAMGFFFWLAGVDYVFLLSLIAIVFAMLPLVGISYLTIAVAIVFVIQGEPVSAAIVLFGFYGVVNWIDVALRPRLIKKEAYTNFALILLGIIGGMVWAGFLGMFIGPTVLLLLVTTIDIYAEWFANDDSQKIRSVLSPDTQGSGAGEVNEIFPDDPDRGSTPP